MCCQNQSFHIKQNFKHTIFLRKLLSEISYSFQQHFHLTKNVSNYLLIMFSASPQTKKNKIVLSDSDDSNFAPLQLKSLCRFIF